MHSKNTYVCVIKEETNSASEKNNKTRKNLNELLKQGYTGDVNARVEPN